MQHKLNKTEVKKFYESLDNVWPINNKWHDVNQKEIVKYLNKIDFNVSDKILNAGSGGRDYNIKCEMYHMDIAQNKNNSFKHFVVGNVEEIPFENDFFDAAICVGSVLNYCDAVKTISELSRVLKKKGTLILEFESSYSYEFKNSSAYKKGATIVTSSYFNKPHKMWVFSPKYILETLHTYNFKIINIYSYHILSSLFYYRTKDENKSAKYAVFDRILRYLPIIRMHSGNIIFRCTKQ